MGRDSFCWTTLLQAPASLAFWMPSYGVLPTVQMEGTCFPVPPPGPLAARFAVGSRTLACGRGVSEAEQQTDTSSAPGAQVFQLPLVGHAHSSQLQTPFPARRQNLSQEE